MLLESARKTAQWFLNRPGISQLRTLDENFYVVAWPTGGFGSEKIVAKHHSTGSMAVLLVVAAMDSSSSSSSSIRL